jgi:hypothetical protein
MTIEIEHDLLEEHRLIAIELKEIKARELDLRAKITDVLLEGLDTGTHNFILHDLHVKAVKGVSHSFDQETISELVDNGDLSNWELGLLRTKYELRLADYKIANFPVDVLEQALIVKPSLPTLLITLGE